MRVKWVRMSMLCGWAPQKRGGGRHFARAVYFVPACASNGLVTDATVCHFPLEWRCMTTVTLASG